MGLEQILMLVLLVTLLFSFCMSIYFNYKHAVLILDVIDSIEESLDILDSRYASISEVLEVPLFYDSPQIRQVHDDLATCRDSILNVASIIGSVEALPQEEPS